MKNFGFDRLVLVNPCALGDEAFMRASHARDVLDSARRMTLDDVYREFDFVVATTGEVSKSVCTPMRMPYYTPAEVRRSSPISMDRSRSSLGGELGLSNAELERANLICTIPTSEVYPILNLSHAVGILCYELAGLPRGTYLLAGPVEMESLYRHRRVSRPDRTSGFQAGEHADTHPPCAWSD